MPISFRKYINITSGVGGASRTKDRDFMLRLVSTSPRLPPDTITELTSSDDVARLLGENAPEAVLARKYFGFISKAITRPKTLSLIRWVDVDSTPRIDGGEVTLPLKELKRIVAGTMTIKIGEVSHPVTGIDLSAAASLADVASMLQTHVIAATLPQAMVTYDAVEHVFRLDIGAGVGHISLTPSGAQDVAAKIGWSGAVFVHGAHKETLRSTITEAHGNSNNYGSLMVMKDLTLDDHDELAQWSAEQNVSFMYLVPMPGLHHPAGDRASWHAELKLWSERLLPWSGTALTIDTGNHEAVIPGIILAATDFSRPGAVQNYMYQEMTGFTPTIQETTESDEIDRLRINYVGLTQKAGRTQQFYQRGYLCGDAKTPQQMGVFAGEMWLKDRVTSKFMDLHLALPTVPADEEGVAMIRGVLSSVITEAFTNGVIRAGRDLTTTQVEYVLQVTNAQDAPQKLRAAGYWMDVHIKESASQAGVTEYAAVYTLLYRKGDSINKVEGSHVLL